MKAEENEVSRHGDTIYLFGEINNTNAKTLIMMLNEYEGRDLSNNPIVRVIINSSGGKIAAGLAVYNTIKTLQNLHGIGVITENIGQVASAATLVFQAGYPRVMHDLSYYLIHPVRNLTKGPTANDVEDAFYNLGVYHRIFEKIYCNDILRPDILWELMKTERYMMADEALRSGLCDTISK